jgi:glycosyltransferase involved in cell wall biosynthesis
VTRVAGPERPLTVGIDARELQGRPTGTGRYLRSLLRLWTATTSDRFFTYFNGEPPDDPVLDHPRVTVRPLPPTSPGLLWQEWRLPRAARADGLDVFFAPAYACPLRLEVPRVTAVHDLSFFAYPQDFSAADAARRRGLVAASARASRALLVCSDFTRREVAAWLPEAAGRTHLVPLGPDDDLPAAPPRDAARSRLGVRGPLVLTVGAVLNRRCLPVLLQVVSCLARSFPGLVLDVVGENRTNPPLDLEGLVRRLDLGASVRLSGFVSEQALAERYAAADVAVFLSEYEGFGLPALEAAARGVPLVTSVRPSLGEIFAEAAALVEPRDAEAIVRAVERILLNPDARDDLVRRGRALAARHSWERTAARTRDVLLSAAQGTECPLVSEDGGGAHR